MDAGDEKKQDVDAGYWTCMLETWAQGVLNSLAHMQGTQKPSTHKQVTQKQATHMQGTRKQETWKQAKRKQERRSRRHVIAQCEKWCMVGNRRG